MWFQQVELPLATWGQCSIKLFKITTYQHFQSVNDMFTVFVLSWFASNLHSQGVNTTITIIVSLKAEESSFLWGITHITSISKVSEWYSPRYSILSPAGLSRDLRSASFLCHIVSQLQDLLSLKTKQKKPKYISYTWGWVKGKLNFALKYKEKNI